MTHPRINPDYITNTERPNALKPGAVLFTVTHDQPPVMSLIEMPDGEKLKAMQAAVNGHIEHLPICQSAHRQFITYDGWVNEDGMINEMPVGLQVRRLVDGRYIMQPVFGSFLITAGESLSGETTQLTIEEMRDIVLFTMRDGMLPIVAVNPEHKDA